MSHTGINELPQALHGPAGRAQGAYNLGLADLVVLVQNVVEGDIGLAEDVSGRRGSHAADEEAGDGVVGLWWCAGGGMEE